MSAVGMLSAVGVPLQWVCVGEGVCVCSGCASAVGVCLQWASVGELVFETTLCVDNNAHR